jgi:hypothetical protein
MEFEIDELAWECWDDAGDAPGFANHAPRWTFDCAQKQTGLVIPEESIQVEFAALALD